VKRNGGWAEENWWKGEGVTEEVERE